MKSKQGFSLIELMIYAAVVAVAGGLLTGILYKSTEVTNRETASIEVVGQLNTVMGTIQKLVGDASLIESVYKTDSDIDPSNDPAPNAITVGNNCGSTETYCTLRLRFENDSEDPSWVVASSTGIYLVRGDSSETGEVPPSIDSVTTTLLTTDKVIVDYLRFTKYEFAGGHASAKVDLSLTYNTANDKFRITRTLTSAIGRVTASTFDDSLLPNVDSLYDIGQAGGPSWRNAAFSGDVIIGGSLILAEGSAPASATGYGKLYTNSGNKGLYFLNSANVTSPVSLNVDTKCLWVSNPTATDDLKSIWTANGFSATITKIWCESDGTVNADLQVDDGTPTGVNGANIACAPGGTPPNNIGVEDEALVGDTTLADGDRLDLAIDTIGATPIPTPTWLSVCWTVTYDF